MSSAGLVEVSVAAEAAFSLDRDAARRLTDEIKADAERLWAKLLEAYEGGAHFALGYSSWGAYFEAEFGGQKSQAYRILDAGRVVALLDSPNGGTPPNERAARELAPLLDQPEVLREVWGEVRERAEAAQQPVTAAFVAEVRDAFTGAAMSSKTDLWETPQDLFDRLHSEFGFTLDVCATPENAKCAAFYTETDDGLAQEWRGNCWMNPPYGDAIGTWVEKARKSTVGGWANVVCLVPARTDTRWWWENCRYGEVRFLRGRLKFGNGENSAPFPSAVVIFGSDVVPKTVYWERQPRLYENKQRAWRRVWYAWPGKHGPGDIRVEFGGKAPSHAEFLAQAYGLFVAEDRYDAPYQEGRLMLKRLLDDIFKAQGWREAKAVIERAEKSVERRTAA